MSNVQKCDKCGKTLVPGRSGPSLPCTMPDGKTKICMECMLGMFEEHTGDWREDPNTAALAKRAKADLAAKTKVPEALFVVSCTYNAGHDVKIDRNAAGLYVVELYFELGTIESRYRPAMDYLVKWVKDRPMPKMAKQLDFYLQNPKSLSNDTCLIIFPIQLDSQPRDDSFFESVLHGLMPKASLPKSVKYLVWKPLFVEVGREIETIEGEWKAWEFAQKGRLQLQKKKVGNIGNKTDQIGFLLGYCE